MLDLYLDTNVLIHLHNASISWISKNARNMINASRLLISPMVQLELQYLYEIKRIKITPNKLIKDLAGEIGIAIDENTTFIELINSAGRISWTRDPFDRMIVANVACKQSAKLLTRDKLILAKFKRAIT